MLGTIMPIEELLWKILTDAWVLGEIGIAIFTYTRPGQGKVQDRGTQLLLWIVIFGSFFIGGWMHASFPADMPGRNAVLLPLAIALMALGLAIRAAAIVNLGRAFSANVATRTAQTLNRSGLYRFVRHPSYLGLEIIFLAAGVHSRRWPCLAVEFIPPTLALLYRIHVEEKVLLAAFGQDYVEYSRTTKRLFPGIY